MDVATLPILAQQLMLNQQQVGLAVIKSNAEAEQAVATILDQAIQAMVPADGSRGSHLDMSA